MESKLGAQERLQQRHENGVCSESPCAQYLFTFCSSFEFHLFFPVNFAAHISTCFSFLVILAFLHRAVAILDHTINQELTDTVVGICFKAKAEYETFVYIINLEARYMCV